MVTASCCQCRAERDSGSGSGEGMVPGLATKGEEEAGPPCRGPRGGWEGTGCCGPQRGHGIQLVGAGVGCQLGHILKDGWDPPVGKGVGG